MRNPEQQQNFPFKHHYVYDIESTFIDDDHDSVVIKIHDILDKDGKTAAFEPFSLVWPEVNIEEIRTVLRTWLPLHYNDDFDSVAEYVDQMIEFYRSDR